MWNYPKEFDVLVIGAGHAGCEAAHIAAKMGASTLLLTMNLDTIGKMSCNPSIGGTSKGHIVREVDALGGLMGKVIDAKGIHFRMLNASKGPSVRSPRAQADKALYALEMKKRLEALDNLEIQQGTIESLVAPQGKIEGVLTLEGIFYRAKTVILSSGTFMKGLLHMGETKLSGGRSGEKAATGLSFNLEQLGFRLGRLKTGTPPRIHKKSIDFTECEEQPGEEGICFSYDEKEERLPQIACYITYTTEKTHEIIRSHLHRSPLFSGAIQSRGPRYCPSIEDKVVRFQEKKQHQIFLEPEGLHTEEVYVNGISSSLPLDVQYEMIHSIPGLQNAKMMRPAYAIEYDYVKSDQIYPSLETKTIEGLFFAGQVNGTTGYEEAAGQGILAGINAAAKVASKAPLILKRSDAYLGVLVDDLIRFDLEEPYRMFTSRAEYRLLLRQDNADLRLRSFAFEYGTISEKQYRQMLEKQKCIEEEVQRLSKTFQTLDGKGASLFQIIARPDWSYEKAKQMYPSQVRDFNPDLNLQIETTIKYAGYIERQQREVKKLDKLEEIKIPKNFDYNQVIGLKTEAKQVLSRFTPETLGSASRLSGLTPSDLSILLVELKK